MSVYTHAVRRNRWTDRFAATLPDGCDFDWLAPALAFDSPGTPLGDSTRVGFVLSRKLRYAIDGKLSWGGAGSISTVRPNLPGVG